MRVNPKKENIDEVPVDKRQKIGRDMFGTGKMAGAQLRTRQAFSVVNSGEEISDHTNGGLGNRNMDCNSVEFRREDVDALLNEKMKGKNKFDYKGKCEHMTEYIKRLRQCIKWFQDEQEALLIEEDKLRRELQSAENKHKEIESQMKKKEEELTDTVAELRTSLTTLQEKFANEESDKLAALDSSRKEIEARLAAEKTIASLSEELEKAHQELVNLNQQMSNLQECNKRLQEYNASLQQYNSKLQTDAAAANESISRIQKEKNAMMETLSTNRGLSTSLQEKLNASKASEQEALIQKKLLMEEAGRLRGEMRQLKEDKDNQLSQVEALTAEVARYKECTGRSTAEMTFLASKTTQLEESYSSQKEQIKFLQQQLAAAQEKLQMADVITSQKNSEFAENKKMLEELQNRLSEAEIQIFEGELLRRRLHNTILELKGNIRVFCRVRPMLPDDDCAGTPVIAYPSSTELQGRGIELIQNSGQKHSFSFDKVFNHDATQEDVFVEISQLVQSALDGYKVCIFAYGQTGSGKTYTMMGRPDTPEQKGLIPRSLEQIFQTSQALSSQGWTFRMQASMLEIYNETIRDLLAANREVSRTENGVSTKYIIKHDNGNTVVSDLTVVDVVSLREVSSLLHRAAQSRSVGRTQMNEQSSRSHFVFTLRISGVNESTEQQVQGVLNLIDLAGSERLSKSGSTGDRLKETQAINKSLSCLGDVIVAISNRESHVPFRNSKLTYLLQSCLGGDSKTLMFVNISPEPSSMNESLCSLRFASKVNACEIGVPRRQTHMRPLDSRLSVS
ncbi:hypothetical protein AMTR_s00098p00155820 [Amborella trichopoda]|uniref:Kinesin-like protein n=1 Tax=Amborella trichopoda TaxID=13333 RepID=W1NW70_AMBTC|nr:hypothetical protein AMTR_s00098p00155820 [Amborella trichopoda]